MNIEKSSQGWTVLGESGSPVAVFSSEDAAKLFRFHAEEYGYIDEGLIRLLGGKVL